MRDIKFRAWDKERKEMREVQLIDWSAWWVSTGSTWERGNPLEYGERNSFKNEQTDRHILMQYTGLQDRNGKDIYEGDIIKINLDQSYVDKPFYICEVTYRADEGYPAFDLEPWIDCGMNALAWLKSESDPSVVSYEVIGNRWDNPDLLGG